MSPRTPVLLLALAGCAVRPLDQEGSDSDADPSATATTDPSPPGTTSTGAPDGPTTGSPATGTTPSEPGASSDDTGDTTQGFVMVPDDGTTKECDVWGQDCPEGQKCMPYSGDGDNSWESLKCVDVVPNPDGFGEPCMVIGGPVSGEDTCDKGLLCWDVDPDTGAGSCIAQCTGSPDAPSCPNPGTVCTFAADGVLTLCIPQCDPLAQDCLGSDVCIPHWSDPNSFLCVLDASGDEGQTFDPCEYANACDPGLLCSSPDLAAECDPQALGCCLPFCDTSAPNTCPGAGQECLPWHEQGTAPPGFEHVGLCGIPMP